MNSTIYISVLACILGNVLSFVHKMPLTSTRSSSLHLSSPKSPTEQFSADIATTSKYLVAGTAALVIQTAFPSVSQAYGDADALLREKKNKAKPKKEEIVTSETDLGIPYRISKKGTGAFPNPGDFVLISYTGFLSDGTVFDTTEGKGKKALGFRMGQKQVIPGLESVIEMLQAGSEATCVIPAKYAYGNKGVCIKDGECLIPPNETLRYAIKVKTVGAGYN